MGSPVKSDDGRNRGIDLSWRAPVLFHDSGPFLVGLDDAVVQVAGKSGSMIVRDLA
jgi:hypothetical protein